MASSLTSAPALLGPGGLSEGLFHSPGEGKLQIPLSNVPDKPFYPLAKHRISEILYPHFPVSQALHVVKSQPEAQALFESPQHLRQLNVPDEIKPYIRVLKNPQTGGVVYVIGTVHIDEASKNDVRMLIEAVQPDVVAVELDPLRLAVLDSGLLGNSESPTTTLGVLKAHWVLPGWYKVWCFYNNNFVTQELGVEGACDMLSAVRTARRLNIPVATIDLEAKGSEREEFQAATNPSLRDFVVFFAGKKELMKAQNHGDTTDEEDAQAYGFKQPVPNACDNQDSASAAYKRVFKAFWNGRPPAREDLLEYRSCENKSLAKMRYDGVNGVLETDGREKKLPPGFLDAMIHVRNNDMGANLAHLTDTKQTVVAVVGADHMQGVRHAFSRHTLGGYINAEGKALYQPFKASNAKYLKSLEDEASGFKQALNQWNENGRPEPAFQMPALTTGRVASAAAVVADGAAIAWRSKQPSRMLKIYGGGLTTVAGGVQLGLAALTANWVQFGDYLEKATHSEKASRE